MLRGWSFHGFCRRSTHQQQTLHAEQAQANRLNLDFSKRHTLVQHMRARGTHPDLEVEVPGFVDAQLLLGLLQKIQSCCRDLVDFVSALRYSCPAVVIKMLCMKSTSWHV